MEYTLVLWLTDKERQQQRKLKRAMKKDSIEHENNNQVRLFNVLLFPVNTLCHMKLAHLTVYDMSQPPALKTRGHICLIVAKILA